MSALLLFLGGCASLPVSGPTGSEIAKQQRDPQTGMHFRLIEVADFAALPGQVVEPVAPVDDLPVQPTDLIGPGDVLNIAIYEPGVALFSGQNTPSALAGSSGVEGVGSGAHVTNLAPIKVDDDGSFRFPFVGRVKAAGLTTEQLEVKVKISLRRMSQDPQVLISIAQSLTNSVIVGGEVSKAGRLTLQTNRETIADVVALSGGYRGETKDLLIRVNRQGRVVDFRLSDIMSGTNRNMVARPGDRIDLIRQPLSFSVMGAAGKVEQIPFGAPTMTLAEAIALAGGANANLGDAKAIFVFRLETGTDKQPLPIVYHVNMMHAGALFLSQRFAMQDKDILYVGNAGFNQPSKLIQVVSQLFSPVVAIESGAAAIR